MQLAKVHSWWSKLSVWSIFLNFFVVFFIHFFATSFTGWIELFEVLSLDIFFLSMFRWKEDFFFRIRLAVTNILFRFLLFQWKRILFSRNCSKNPKDLVKSNFLPNRGCFFEILLGLNAFSCQQCSLQMQNFYFLAIFLFCFSKCIKTTVFLCVSVACVTNSLNYEMYLWFMV